MSVEILPTLTAHYLAAYRTLEYSGGWGLWQTKKTDIAPAHRHDPGRILPNGELDIASVYMPVIGVYDSGDPDLCEYHILLAKAVGISGFTVDWYGPQIPGTHERVDNNVKVLIKTAEKLNFKIALCFQERSCFPPLRQDVDRREQALEIAEASFTYAREHYFKSPAYLHFSGRPVVTTLNHGMFGEDAPSASFSPGEWEEIQKTSSVDLCLVNNYHPRRAAPDFSLWNSVYPWGSVYLSDFDSDEEFWDRSFKALGQGRFQFISGLVSPGFDNRGIESGETGGLRVFSRRQGAKYSSTWEDNLKHEARFIQIATWNNFGDGSGIEPAKEIVLHKNAAVPGWGYRELITTREYAGRFTRDSLWPLPALFLPERLYHLRKSNAPEIRGDRIRLYLLEGDITGATLGLEQAGV